MNRIANILAIALVGLAAAGCSVLHKVGSTKHGDSGEVVTQTHPGDQASRSGDAAAGIDAKVKWLARLDGEWSIVRVSKTDVREDPENMPYIYFEIKNGRFYASNGCSILNGSFTDAGDNSIKFSEVLSTMNDCPDAAYRQDINRVLTDGVKVSLYYYTHGYESFLDLISTGNTKLMTLRRHNLEAINGKWLVSKIGDIDVNDPEVNLFFDMPERKVHGNTGCNYFNGNILVDPSVDSSLTFENMGVTMRMCENQETEMAMLVALEEACTYRKQGNELVLYSSSGKAVMRLSR